MATTPNSYYELFVVPNLEDYLKEPDNIRLGFNACVSAYQLGDIVYAYWTRHDPSKIVQWRELKHLHRELVRREPMFLTVQSVATVYKHLHGRNSFYEVGSPGALWSLKFPSIKTEFKSEWDDEHPKGDVIVRRRNGSEVSLTAALNAVIYKLWPAVLTVASGGKAETLRTGPIRRS
jgi:hypothetical protein